MPELNPTAKEFIVHWGEMGSRWGINRTVAQIHALLYIAPEPLTAEEISDCLAVARSTVSTGLRELQSWNIVKVVHVLGDRRDRFEVIGDVWEMFRAVLDERKRREIDPALEMLRETIDELEEQQAGYTETRQKMIELLDFFETAAQLYEELETLPTPVLVKLAKRKNLIERITTFVRGT